MEAKEVAHRIRQVAEECTKEGRSTAALVELLQTKDLPSREDLFRELGTLFCTPTVPGIIARLMETLTPSQTLEEACSVASRALVLATRERLTERATAPSSPPVYEIQTLKESGRVMEWHAALLAPIAIALGCVGVKVPGEALEVVGIPYDINTVQTIFSHLVTVVDRLAIDQPKRERPKWREEAAHAIATATWEAYSDLLLELRRAKPLDLDTAHRVAVHKETTKALVQYAKDSDERKHRLGARKGRRATVLEMDHPKH